jgi:hypothetical protein
VSYDGGGRLRGCAAPAVEVDDAGGVAEKSVGVVELTE